MANVGTNGASLYQTNLNADGVLYADASGVINSTTVGTSTNVLTSNGAGVAPTFQAVSASGATTSLAGDSGTATPSSGVITVNGGSTGLTTSGSSHTLSLTGTLGVANGGTGDASLTSYAVLCGGATSTGAVQSIAGVGTSGQILTSNGTGALPTFQSAAGGNFVLISKQSASSSASITFTSGISSTYSTYMLVVSNAIPATNGTSLQMQFSTNGGSSYLNSGYASGVTVLLYNSAVPLNGNSSSAILIDGSVDNTQSVGSSATLTLYGLNTANNKIVSGTGTYFNAGNPYMVLHTGLLNTASAVNAIQITFSSGNITSGVFALYGLT